MWETMLNENVRQASSITKFILIRIKILIGNTSFIYRLFNEVL